jgi:alanyl-tRNA synthetase
VLKQEEERFGETLEHGMKILEAALAANSSKLDGETAFKLYDTYGFPLDLTADICRERNVDLDEAGFDAAMERQKSAARAAGKFKMAAPRIHRRQDPLPRLRSPGAGPRSWPVQGRRPVQKLEAGQDGVVVLDTTPFYAESGGQVGDAGALEAANGLFAVADTQRSRPTCSATTAAVKGS